MLLAELRTLKRIRPLVYRRHRKAAQVLEYGVSELSHLAGRLAVLFDARRPNAPPQLVLDRHDVR